MEYNDLKNKIKEYNVNDEQICLNVLGVYADKIKENVVIAPSWEIESLINSNECEPLQSRNALFSSYKLWNIKKNNIFYTYIKTGFGAPLVLDALLALGNTKCKTIVFIGSAGALDKHMAIGDVIIPKSSFCGDGASRYISSDCFNKDVFCERVFPETTLFNKLKIITEETCDKNNVNWHIGINFSVDSIFSQYYHLENIMQLGCNCIDMETSVAFRASQLIKIPIVSIFSVSDNTLNKKSLIKGREQSDKQYRHFVKNIIIPELVLSLFK